jgi:SAM-dependent methyltransferase
MPATLWLQPRCCRTTTLPFVSDAVERRLVFGSVAEQYDRHRPSYPPELVDHVLSYAGAVAGDRALEVGAGTGIATRQFAARGLAITAVEPDAAMAAVASERAATDGTSVDLRITDFEHVEFEPHSFQLVYSGTAWHWTDPETSYARAARALSSGGALATFWNRPVWDGNPVRPGFDAAYASVADAFKKVIPGPMNPIGDVELISGDYWLGELKRSPELGDPQVRTFRWTHQYTRDEYLGLLGTHSDHILIGDEDRARLLDGVAVTIDANGGSFELTYEALLCLARRS